GMLIAGEIAVKQTVRPAHIPRPHRAGDPLPAGIDHFVTRPRSRRPTGPSHLVRVVDPPVMGQARVWGAAPGGVRWPRPGGQAGAVTIWRPNRDGRRPGEAGPAARVPGPAVSGRRPV